MLKCFLTSMMVTLNTSSFVNNSLSIRHSRVWKFFLQTFSGIFSRLDGHLETCFCKHFCSLFSYCAYFLSSLFYSLFCTSQCSSLFSPSCLKMLWLSLLLQKLGQIVPSQKQTQVPPSWFSSRFLLSLRVKPMWYSRWFICPRWWWW